MWLAAQDMLSEGILDCPLHGPCDCQGLQEGVSLTASLVEQVPVPSDPENGNLVSQKTHGYCRHWHNTQPPRGSLKPDTAWYKLPG